MLTLTLTLLLGCRDRIERCDGLDNDGDGLVDDNDPDVTGLKWHEDLDGDSFGNPATERRQCRQPGGYVADSTDCDDGNEAVRPNVEEVCDGVDNDCDGLADDDDASVTDAPTWYADDDEERFGDPDDFVVACAQPEGTIQSGTDCDDTNATVHPNAHEVCDGLDDDCDGLTDDEDQVESGQIYWDDDVDGDGYGFAGNAAFSCVAPPGMVEDNTDCDDAAADVNPGADEVCNDYDDDCDALIDGQDPSLSGASTWYTDADGDGYGDSSTAETACHAPMARWLTPATAPMSRRPATPASSRSAMASTTTVTGSPMGRTTR